MPERSAYGTCKGKLERNKSLRRNRSEWEDNSKFLSEKCEREWTCFFWIKICRFVNQWLVDSSGHRNEHSGSTNYRDFEQPLGQCCFSSLFLVHLSLDLIWFLFGREEDGCFMLLKEQWKFDDQTPICSCWQPVFYSAQSTHTTDTSKFVYYPWTEADYKAVTPVREMLFSCRCQKRDSLTAVYCVLVLSSFRL